MKKKKNKIQPGAWVKCPRCQGRGNAGMISTPTVPIILKCDKCLGAGKLWKKL